MGVVPAYRHGKAVIKVFLCRNPAVLLHQIALQIKVAHRFPVGAVVILRLFRQNILPQCRYQRRRVIFGLGQLLRIQAGGVAQVNPFIGVFLRRPVVQRVYPALEFTGVLQCGQRRQQLLLAVGAVSALHLSAVGIGVGNFQPPHKSIAAVRQGFAGAATQ